MPVPASACTEPEPEPESPETESRVPTSAPFSRCPPARAERQCCGGVLKGRSLCRAPCRDRAEVLRALWQYDLELIELSNPKLPPPSKKAKKEL